MFAKELTPVLCLLPQIYRQNREMLRLDREQHEAMLSPASIPIATDKLDVANLPLVKQIHADHQKQKHAMMRHLQQRRDAKVLKLIEAAARYNAAHEQLQTHNAGKQSSILQCSVAQQPTHALQTIRPPAASSTPPPPPPPAYPPCIANFFPYAFIKGKQS